MRSTDLETRLSLIWQVTDDVSRACKISGDAR